MSFCDFPCYDHNGNIVPCVSKTAPSPPHTSTIHSGTSFPRQSR